MKKKKILLLSDDLRFTSGIASQSRELILATVHKYDWVQLGAAVNHPEKGKYLDFSEEAQKITGVKDASVKIIPTNGYGTPDEVRFLINMQKPDAILHFTDPRFWGWLYQMEHEIRQEIPIMYWTIWDDLPFPYWNEPFYESCDLLMGISKQTTNIVKNVIRKYPKPDWAIKYVPHGVNTKIFSPIVKDEAKIELVNFRNQVMGNRPADAFIVLFANRNIKRKNPGDVILAFKHMCSMLKKEDAAKAILVMHTSPIDENGTDLTAVIRMIAPDVNIVFTKGNLTVEQLNQLYNLADVTINMASNEGFGLTTCESLAAGTPIVVNVTGGLQDQCGFRKESVVVKTVQESKGGPGFLTDLEPGDLVQADDMDSNWGSNHDGRYRFHGKWAKPVFPSNRSLQGSPQTPYIFDDRCRYEDAGLALKHFHDMTPDERHLCGIAGRDYVMGEGGLGVDNMAEKAIESIDTCFEKFTPRKRFDIFKPGEPNTPVGSSGFQPT